jgi:hypothetical protein
MKSFFVGRFGMDKVFYFKFLSLNRKSMFYSLFHERESQTLRFSLFFFERELFYTQGLDE